MKKKVKYKKKREQLRRMPLDACAQVPHFGGLDIASTEWKAGREKQKHKCVIKCVILNLSLFISSHLPSPFCPFPPPLQYFVSLS